MFSNSIRYPRTPMIICPCPAPKRVITSASKWYQRNNSSNINAILHPENYSISHHPLRYEEKIVGNVKDKPMLSKNKCYCTMKTNLIKPTFLNRPNSCIGLKNKKINPFTSFCICEEDSDNRDDEKISVSAANFDGETSLLKFTDQRKDYETYRKNEEIKFENEIETEHRKSDENVNTILGTQRPTNNTLSSLTNCNCGSLFDEETNTENLSTEKVQLENCLSDYITRTVPDFRDDHYFQTHNVDKYKKYLAKDDHACIHQFQLDENWSADPVKQDIYGRSRCKICYRPMEDNLGSSVDITERKSNFMPTTTRISSNKPKSRIELILTPKDVKKMEKFMKKASTQQFQNSLALRQQKMRCST